MIGSSSHSSSDSSSHSHRSQAASGSVLTSAEADALRRAFRESIKAKEDQIAALTNRLHELQQQPPLQLDDHNSPTSQEHTLEVQDLQDENQFLRHEFDRLKTRYETLVSRTHSTSKTK